MTTTIKTIRTSMLAAPLALAAGMATAGGLAEPVTEPAPVMTPAPAPVMMGSDWTGFYAGGQVGYGELSGDTLDEDIDGATYGVHGGYLYDFGSIVVGGELDFDGTNVEDEDIDLAVDSVARAKLRVGYDAGAFMPYLVGGVARVSVDSAGTTTDDTGTFGGIGLDYQATPSIRVGAEVLQHQFDDFDDSGVDFDATTAAARVSFSF